MTHPLKRPLNVVLPGKAVEIFERGEVVLLYVGFVLFEQKVKDAVVHLDEPVNHLRALVDDVLIQILRLGCELGEHLEGLGQEVFRRHVKRVVLFASREFLHLLLQLADQLLSEVDLLLQWSAA